MAVAFDSAWNDLPRDLQEALRRNGVSLPHHFAHLLSDPNDHDETRNIVRELLGDVIPPATLSDLVVRVTEVINVSRTAASLHRRHVVQMSNPDIVKALHSSKACRPCCSFRHYFGWMGFFQHKGQELGIGTILCLQTPCWIFRHILR